MDKLTLSNSQLNRYQFAVIVLALFAFIMSAVISHTVFDHLPHLEDELAYLYQAKIFAGGNLVIDSPDPRQAFWQPFVVDYDGTRFGKYTPGWSAILALGVIIGQTWSINAFFAMLAVAMTYRLGADIYNRDVALVAALLVAFSPAALLLNASLMGHTSAMFFALLFVYSYWRLSYRAKPHRWGLVAGLALGILATERPLTSIAIALPFIAWSGVRLLHRGIIAKQKLREVAQVLSPLLVLSAGALLIASAIPIFNHAATGDPTKNLYTFVWEYDRIGFGECCGRNGHTLEKAIRHTRFDLSLTAADMFGWQIAPVTDDIIDHLQGGSTAYPATGYSFWLLPFGVLIGVFTAQTKQRKATDLPKKRTLSILLLVWAILLIAWWFIPQHLESDIAGRTLATWLNVEPAIITNPTVSWGWILLGLSIVFAPMLLLVRWQNTPQVPYTWLFTSLVLSIVMVQMLYWIGSQRYSTRYYYEALFAAALLTALPIHWLMQRLSNRMIYVALVAVCIATLFHYSLPRIGALHEFNRITPDILHEIEDRRDDDNPVLVIVNGTTSGENRVRWRSYGTLMAVTSPYLNSDIVVARDYGTSGMRDDILANFEGYQIIEMLAVGNHADFLDD